MCQSKAEGGSRCELSDGLSNLRRKVRYSKKYQELTYSEDKDELVEKEVRKWKNKNKKLVAEHAPKSSSFTTRAKHKDVSHVETLSSSDIPLDEGTLISLNDDARSFEQQCRKDGFEDYDESIRTYKLMGYKTINAYLREGHSHQDVLNDEALSDEYGRGSVRTGYELDSLFDNYASSREVKVMRHVNLPAGWTGKQYAEKYYSPGSLVRHKEFLSTTHSPDYIGYRTARKREGDDLAFIIHTNRSLPAYSPEDKDNLQSQEYERILPREESFRVIGSQTETFTHNNSDTSVAMFTGARGGDEKVTVVHLMREELFKDSTKNKAEE